MPQVDCQRASENLSSCNCTWEPCAKKGNCCLCLQYHLSSRELPACFFPADVERTYDRSIRKFAQLYEQGFRPMMQAVATDGVECPRREQNLEVCSCDYEECELRGICCLCIRSHLSQKQLPACVGQLV